MQCQRHLWGGDGGGGKGIRHSVEARGSGKEMKKSVGCQRAEKAANATLPNARMGGEQKKPGSLTAQGDMQVYYYAEN